MDSETVRKPSNRSISKYLTFIFTIVILSLLSSYSSLRNVRVDLRSFDIFDSYGASEKDDGIANDDHSYDAYDNTIIKAEAPRPGVKDGFSLKKMIDNETHTTPMTFSDEIEQQPKLSDTDVETQRRLNILVLYPDDWRWNAIGRENSVIHTPFLDSLGDDGMRFQKNCVTSSICWLSRATLFSGHYLSRHQSLRLKCPHFAKWDRWQKSYPKILQNNGYFVGHVGKWQYYSDNNKRFDWSRWHEGQHWYRMYGNKYVSADDRACDDAVAFLRQRPKEKPFALTVAFYPPKPVGSSSEPGAQWKPKNETLKLYQNLTIAPPHGANATFAFEQLPEFLKNGRSAAVSRWRQRYVDEQHYQQAMKNIYALITQVDDACRRIVDELKQQGEYNNTMIIFTTDNGMFYGSHGLAGKWYPYQESIRVPLIIYDPRMPSSKRGIVDGNYTLNIDLASTILGAAGLEPDPNMQGRDISDLYLQNMKDGKTALQREPWRQEFFYEFRFADKNFIPGSDALVNHKYKYIEWVEHGNYAQLFDLENDPFEVRDLLHHEPSAESLSIAQEMQTRLHQWAHKLRDNEPNLGCENGDYSVNPPKDTNSTL